MPDRHPDIVLNRTLWPILDTEDLLAAVYRIIATLSDAGVGNGAPAPRHTDDQPLDLWRLEADLDYARWALAERGIDTYGLW